MSDVKQQKQVATTTPVDKYAKLAGLGMPHEPAQVRDLALKELESCKDGKFESRMDSPITRAMTLREFDNGVLMSMAVDDQYKTFAIQMSLDLQKQYKCDTVGTKSLAELTSLNYCRIIEIQRRINAYLQIGEITDRGVKYLGIISKELDRAQRHYLTSIQALEVGLQPPMNMTVRTQVANVANQQMVKNQIEQDKKEYGI